MRVQQNNTVSINSVSRVLVDIRVIVVEFVITVAVPVIIIINQVQNMVGVT